MTKEKTSESKKDSIVEEVIDDVKDALTTKKAKKIERYIIFAIYAVVLLVAGYFILVNTNPDVLPDGFYNYEISADSAFMTNSLRSLYLEDSEALGGVTTISDETVRMVVLEKPFNFVFNPKRKIEENATAKIRLEFVKAGTEVYLNDELIIPDLDGYVKVADFEETTVWTKDELVKPLYSEGDNAEEFIYANFPGENFYSFGEVAGGTPILYDYEKTTTRINTRFRGGLKLAVYAEGDLEIEFVKQDLNSYIGADEYTVEISDLEGNIYFEEVYEDDGDKKDTGIGEFEQKISLEGRDLPRGIYYITFTKDENNKGTDSTIKNIKINSNKVLIVGQTLPIDEFEFYTEVSSPQTIGFKYWWSSKEQEIKQSGIVDDIINLDEDWLNKRYEQELKVRGDYYFEIETGMVWVYSETISPRKENWFYFPKEGDKKLINSDIVIIDKNQLQIDGESAVYTGEIAVESKSKIKIQVLDKLETYFKEIKLVL